jgi:hypothetical protein
MEYDSAEDMNQSAQYPEETIDYEKTKGDVLEGLFDFAGNANSEYTMVNTQEKEVVDGKLVIDKSTGKPKDNSAMSDPSYPLDAKKVNSAEFLNNKQLAEENHNVEIRVADITNNRWAQENMDNLTPENYPMDVIHIDPVTGEETFLSRLPAFQAGKSANQLRALRNEVMRRDKMKTDPGAKTRAERIQEISEEIETLEKEIETAKPESELPDGFRYVEEGEVIPAGDYTTRLSVDGKRTMTNAPRSERTIEEKVAEIQENQEFIQLSDNVLLSSLSRTRRKIKVIKHY